MKVTLVIRRIEDYLHGNFCNFGTKSTSIFNFNNDENSKNTRAKINYWNKNFSIPYIEVRKKLFDIAFKNIESFGFDSVFDRVNDDVLQKISTLNDDHWIVPVDDDDWISIYLADALRNLNCNERMCHWTCCLFSQNSIFEGNPNFVEDQMSNRGVMRSCSYAIRPSLGSEIIMYHGKTKGVKSYFLEGVRSFYTRTPASVSFLNYHSDKVFKMWKGMSKLNENDVPEEFREKIIMLKGLFKKCVPIKTL